MVSRDFIRSPPPARFPRDSSQDALHGDVELSVFGVVRRNHEVRAVLGDEVVGIPLGLSLLPLVWIEKRERQDGQDQWCDEEGPTRQFDRSRFGSFRNAHERFQPLSGCFLQLFELVFDESQTPPFWLSHDTSVSQELVKGPRTLT